ncbi:MAG: N-6 DNA methylase, partial [Rhodospirillales bacterium]
MSHLSPEWAEALSLSHRRAPEFYQATAEIEPGPYAEAIRFALSELRLAAVFCIEGVPTIGFLNEPDAPAERIDLVHRVLWNQGLMSLLLVIRNDELIAYSLVNKPFIREAGVGTDPRLITTLSLLVDSLKLRELIHSTESGRFWYENDSFFDPAQRVDNVLLSNLLQAFREIKDELGGEAAQALLMQTMFIAYLEDRKIIGANVFRQASSGTFSTFAELLEAKTPVAFERLFIWLKDAFNGNVFNAPCGFDFGSAPPPKIKTHHLRVLARFRHGREEMVSRQLRFWGYDFQYMPIALISAVYDRFLKEEADKKNAEGAFYTPMFLADMVVNQVWDELTNEQKASGIFYDPACGSGIFLVRLFQRLVAHHCRSKKRRHANWNELTAIARRLHGGDINTSAVRVAAFSLYIALLEHSNPPDLPALIEKGKLLPSLYRDTLRPAEDFFGTPDEGRYDAVVGNPPWKGRAGQITTAQKWAKTQGLPDPAKDIAWGFVLKALR